MKKNFKQRGFTMTELMVGMAIGMLGTIIIMKAFTNSSTISENINSVSDATQNGSIGLFTIEQDARNAGYGINYDELLGCTVVAHNRTLASGAQNFNFVLSPATITQGVGTASDMIRLNYSRVSSILPLRTTLSYDGTQTPIALSSRYGLEPGNIIVIAESGKNCTMRQISAVPTAAGDNTITHDTTNYTDAFGNSQPVIHNKVGGAGITYQTGAAVFNFGTTPASREYYIENNRLMVRNQLTNAAPQVVVPDIVLMKANYGMVDNSGVVTFTNTTPTTPADWRRASSIRVALVARSRTPDYTKGTGSSCAITVDELPWSGGTLDVSDTSTEWKCYRYRVFETTILMRNMIWTPA